MLAQSLLFGLSPSTWVSIAVLIVGLLTLGVVSYEFYLNHLRTKQSDIRLEQMETTNSMMRHDDSGGRSYFRFDVLVTNQGQRDGRIANRGELLEAVFRGTPGERRISSSDCGGGHVQTQLPTKDERRVEPEESAQLRIQTWFPNDKGIADLVNDYDEAAFCIAVDVEDAEQKYTLTVEDDIEFSGVTWRP